MNTKDVRAAERAALEQQLHSATSPWDRLPLLLELTREPTRNDPHYAYHCAQEALSLAKELNDPFWTACSLRSIGVFLLRTSRYSDVLHYLHEAARIFGQLNDVRMKAQTDVPIAGTYLYMGKMEEALKLLIPCKHIFESTGPPHWLSTTLRSLGTFYQEIGEHSKAIEYYQQAVAIAIESNLPMELGTYYANIATVYGSIGDQKSMKEYSFKALALFRDNDWTTGLLGIITNVSLMYLDQGRYARAEKYTRLAGKMSRSLGHTLYEGMAWGRLGTIYTHKNEFAKAFRCFRKALLMTRDSQHSASRGALYQNFGELYIKMERYKHGISYLKKALSMVNRSALPRHQYQIHRALAGTYEAIGDVSRALKHYKEYTRIKEEYINTEKSLELGRMEMRIQIQNLTGELEKERLRSDMLGKEIEKKESELVALTLNLIRNTEANRKQDRTINCLQEEAIDLSSENWEIFSRQFHKIHHGFYPDLVRRFPQLTPTEIKICSLIRIGLSSKEIAGLLCISKRTVDNHRARAHKKMNLPQGSSLSGFIMRM